MSATGGQYEKRNTITQWIELISLFLSPGSMWTVKQLLVSMEQLRELLAPLALEQEQEQEARMQESALLHLQELTVLAQSAIAGALDREIQVLIWDGCGF